MHCICRLDAFLSSAAVSVRISHSSSPEPKSVKEDADVIALHMFGHALAPVAPARSRACHATGSTKTAFFGAASGARQRDLSPPAALDLAERSSSGYASHLSSAQQTQTLQLRQCQRPP
eukprot:CAMPEP_0115867108 /NCGR_PEP_ID=MMETSP0287-20121206/20597_1 /TAXON_ID=412157 /ORGANISM="Chrysochromulina rotalis, Strain UIO044" /LENGTH=118 /DNA_ID=CAMNT_0003321701 /DNA_START=108 /DNA_END=465 /DNA_ORIENTATION=-